MQDVESAFLVRWSGVPGPHPLNVSSTLSHCDDWFSNPRPCMDTEKISALMELNIQVGETDIINNQIDNIILGCVKYNEEK